MQNLVNGFSNVSSPNNSAGWEELERVSCLFVCLFVLAIKFFIILKMNPGQNQILLNSVERLGILLAGNLHRGLTPTIVTDSISMCYLNMIAIHVILLLYTGMEAKSVNTSTSNIVFYDTNNSIEIPASFIRHRSNSTGSSYHTCHYV